MENFAITGFPDPFLAPNKLLRTEGNCGPISVWCMLKYFRKRCSPENILKYCKYTKKHGSFTIGLALGLVKFGLKIKFFTSYDEDISVFEKKIYSSAKRLNLSINDAISIETLLKQIDKNNLAIVFYDSDDSTGHFSPLIGVKDNNLLLPYEYNKSLSIDIFLNRWNAKGINNQCLLVSFF